MLTLQTVPITLHPNTIYSQTEIHLKGEVSMKHSELPIFLSSSLRSEITARYILISSSSYTSIGFPVEFRANTFHKENVSVISLILRKLKARIHENIFSRSPLLSIYPYLMLRCWREMTKGSFLVSSKV